MAFAQISIIGNLGKDPEFKTLDSGAQLASFSVAVTEKFKKRDGSQQEKTTWFRVDAWQQGPSGLVSGVIQPYLKRGQMVFLQGAPTIDEYEKDGVKKQSFKIRLGGPGSVLQMMGGAKGDTKSDSAPASHAPQTLDDDIPF